MRQKQHPLNDSYMAGWDWAGDSLTWMPWHEVRDMAESAAYDLGDLVGDAEMCYEGIIDRVEAHIRAKSTN